MLCPLQERGIKMNSCHKLCFKEIPYGSNQEFIFDDTSIKLFREDFWEEKELPKDIIIPSEIQENSLSLGYPKEWAYKCPLCSSWNCHKYKNAILCFNCKSREIFPNNRLNYDLIIVNGYLARRNKKTGYIEFLHRFLMKNILKHHQSMEIHHLDLNKKNNSLTNLKELTKDTHDKIHSRNLLDLGIHDKYYEFCIKNKMEYSDFNWASFFENINT